MRPILIIIYTLFLSQSFATGQEGELIIYQGDTLQMMSEPLEMYLKENEPREKFYPFLKNGCSKTSLWRGYIGLWELKNNRLLLRDVFACGNKRNSIKHKVFTERDSAIFADWFSGELFIQRGKLLKYNHTGYDRYYEREVVVEVANGIVHKKTEYKNGVKPDDKRFSRDINEILEEIYRRVNWRKLPKLSKYKKILASITLDCGKLESEDSVIDRQNIEEIYKTEIKRIIKDFPEVQVFYAGGKPLKESYYGAVIFSRANKRKYAP